MQPQKHHKDFCLCYYVHQPQGALKKAPPLMVLGVASWASRPKRPVCSQSILDAASPHAQASMRAWYLTTPEQACSAAILTELGVHEGLNGGLEAVEALELSREHLGAAFQETVQVCACILACCDRRALRVWGRECWEGPNAGAMRT
jgi:hypothetical protein